MLQRRKAPQKWAVDSSHSDRAAGQRKAAGVRTAAAREQKVEPQQSAGRRAAR